MGLISVGALINRFFSVNTVSSPHPWSSHPQKLNYCTSNFYIFWLQKTQRFGTPT